MALEKAGVNEEIEEVDGDSNGKLTGIIRENGVSLITDRMPMLSKKSFIKEMIIKG